VPKADPGVPGPPIPASVDASALEQRLRSAIQCVIRETRGFNERKQEAWCRVCRYKDPLHTKLHDPDCPIYELHGAWEEWEARLKVLAAPRAPLEGEQSCQAATGDTAGDIGVIEPSVFDAESVAVPTDSPRAPLEPREEKSWLIFDERSECFWGPNRGGYWKGLTHAGLYTEQEAREAENFAKRYGRNEVAVPLERYRAEIERLADALATRPRPALGPQE
jgi:hypothetical protein